MKLCFALLLCSGLLSDCGWLSANAGAPVTGRVTFRGVPPPEVAIRMDPSCAKLQTNPPTTRHYVVSTNGGLANVFVVIRAKFDTKQLPPVSTNEIRMEFAACQLQPYVIAARTGQPVHFENVSTISENLHGTARRNLGFNYAFPGGAKRSFTFDTPEEYIRITGEVHPWMLSYICVVGHPFFAVTGADGTFTLPAGLPDGTHTLEASHLKAGSQKKELTVRAGRAEPVEFTFTVPAR